MGKLSYPPLQCLELWPTEAEISLSLTYHQSEYLVWEALGEVGEQKKLKLQIMQCQLLAATKLFHSPVERPLKLKSRYMHATCLNYIADDGAFKSSSSSFLLSSYPIGFFSELLRVLSCM